MFQVILRLLSVSPLDSDIKSPHPKALGFRRHLQCMGSFDRLRGRDQLEPPSLHSMIRNTWDPQILWLNHHKPHSDACMGFSPESILWKVPWTGLDCRCAYYEAHTWSRGSCLEESMGRGHVSRMSTLCTGHDGRWGEEKNGADCRLRTDLPFTTTCWHKIPTSVRTQTAELASRATMKVCLSNKRIVHMFLSSLLPWFINF